MNLLFSRPYNTHTLRPMLLTVAWLFLIVGICFLAPLCVALYTKDAMGEVFFLCSFFSVFLGGLMIFAFQQRKVVNFAPKDGLLLTVLCWVSVSIISALPFWLSNHKLSFLDALFEATASLTTTGITLHPGGSSFHASLLFWRVLLQWIGGFGIMLMAITLLPILKIGGSPLVLNEFSDRSEKIMPRFSQVGLRLMVLYVALTVVGGLLMSFSIPDWMSAWEYSLSAISTGGIVSRTPLSMVSTYGHCILIGLMLCGGATFTVLIGALRCPGKLIRDDQMRGYFKTIGVIWLGVWVYSSFHRGIGGDVGDGIHSNINGGIGSLFFTLSSLTTTGFQCYDGPLSTLCVIASLIGGCSGSTTGGLKIFRLQMAYRTAKSHLLGTLKMFGTFVPAYDAKAVDAATLGVLMTSLFCYLAGWLVFALCFGFLGQNFQESFMLSASIITNSGLFFDTVVVAPMTNILTHGSNLLPLTSLYSSTWKVVMILGMLCGRFEFLTLIGVLVMPFSNHHWGWPWKRLWRGFKGQSDQEVMSIITKAQDKNNE